MMIQNFDRNQTTIIALKIENSVKRFHLNSEKFCQHELFSFIFHQNM